MGWWSRESKDTELMLGDESLDAALVMLEKTVRAYRNEFGREPTLEEIAETIRLSLNTVMAEMADAGKGSRCEVVSVVIETRELLEEQKLCRGDYFGIPLSGGGYGYGRVISIHMKELLVVEFLSMRSADILQLSAVAAAPTLMRVSCGAAALRSGEWPVVGNVRIAGRQPSYDETHRGLPDTYPPAFAARLLEWRLDGNPGTPWKDVWD